MISDCFTEYDISQYEPRYVQPKLSQWSNKYDSMVSLNMDQ